MFFRHVNRQSIHSVLYALFLVRKMGVLLCHAEISPMIISIAITLVLLNFIKT